MKELSSDDLAYGTTRHLLTFQGSGIGESGEFNLQPSSGSGIMTMTNFAADESAEGDCEQCEEDLDNCLEDKADLVDSLNECGAALATSEETVAGLEEDIVDLESALTASFGCTSFGYGIYQYNMMNGYVCISTYTNSLGQKRLKMDWSAVGNQVTVSPGSGGGQGGSVKLYCNVWSDTAKIGQVSWGNSDNIIMPYRFHTPLKGPVTLSGSYTSNNYPIGGSATHIRLTPQTDSTYIAGIIRISQIPEFL